MELTPAQVEHIIGTLAEMNQSLRQLLSPDRNETPPTAHMRRLQAGEKLAEDLRQQGQADCETDTVPDRPGG